MGNTAVEVVIRGSRQRVQRLLDRVRTRLEEKAYFLSGEQKTLLFAVRTPVWGPRRGRATVHIDHDAAEAIAQRLSEAARHAGLQAVERPAPPEAQRPRPAPYYVHGNWSHIFHDNGPDTPVRFAMDARDGTVLAMDVQNGATWRRASALEVADVQDSLLNANDVLTEPGQWGLTVSGQLPEWAQGEARADSAHSARYVTEALVADPDTGDDVAVAVYKDRASGGMFGVDESYVERMGEGETVAEPFYGRRVALEDEPDAAAVMWQPKAAYMPEELASFEVFSSLDAAMEAFPQVPRDAWEGYREGEIEQPVFLDASESARQKGPTP